jgi:hypothetical protein
MQSINKNKMKEKKLGEKKIKIYVLIFIGILIFIFFINFSTYHKGDFVFKLTPEERAIMGKVEAKSLFGGTYVVSWQNNEIEEISKKEIYSIDEINEYQLEKIIKKSNNTNYYTTNLNPKDFQVLSSNLNSKSLLNRFLDLILPIRKKNCNSEYICSNWSNCYADYNIKTITEIKEIKGLQGKICIDKNHCLPEKIITKECELKIPIVLKKISKTEIEIYSENNSEKVGKISLEKNPENPKLNLSF